VTLAGLGYALLAVVMFLLPFAINRFAGKGKHMVFDWDKTRDPAHLAALQEHEAAARAALPGPDYLWWLGWFHGLGSPRTYLEVGVRNGASLRLAQGSTHAIGIDPAFNIACALDAPTRLYRETSDEFFGTRDVREVLTNGWIDMAFVDGMHLFENALADLLHIEHLADDGAVVLLHDVLPTSHATTSRERSTIFWAGDVWKVPFILREHRPDLRVLVIPCYPSGLAVVTRLKRQQRAPMVDWPAVRNVWERRASRGNARDWLQEAGMLVDNDPDAVRDALTA